MKKNNFSILYFIFLWIFISCKNESGDTHPPINDTPTGVIPNIAEVEINNAYTEILNKMCNHQEFSDLKYTTRNTDFYPIKKEDTTALFLSVSEIDCGYTPGSCGRNIEIIKKDKNQYVSIYKACGKILDIRIDSMNKQLTLLYSSSSERITEVLYDGKEVASSVVSYFGMPIEDLRFISDDRDILINNFILRGKKTENLDAILMDFSQYTLEENLTVNVYSFTDDSTTQYYVFLKEGKKIIQKIKNSEKVIVQKNGTEILITEKETQKALKYNQAMKKFI